ncbi:hypothetical protein [Xanthomarina gelatinilytica]|uniref:hypothetical protein n=1 Tax=Xanthomarina gelatinilytica TaxID=1137281 RepID=UPI003AA90773
MKQVSNIAQGWGKYFKGEVGALEKERAKECEQCPEAIVGTFERFMPDNSLKEIQGLKCNICKCPLSAKLRSKNESCPLGKW